MTSTIVKHDPQYVEAQKILNNLPTDHVTQLYKTTRSGATTGLCAAAFDANMKVSIVAPTIDISVKTFDKSTHYTSKAPNTINIANVPGNRACILIKEMIDKNKDLEALPIIPLPKKCDKCRHIEECEVMKFLRSDNVDGVGLTHQKLSALLHSSAETAKAIIEKLLTMNDVMIVDEAHKLETDNASSVQVYPYPDMDNYTSVREKYPIIDKFVCTFNNIRTDNDESVIQQFVTNTDVSTHMLMSIGVINDTNDEEEYEQPDFKDVVSAIKDIVEIMKHRSKFDLSVADVVYLSNIVMVLSGDHLVMHYIKAEAGSDDIDQVYLSSPGGMRNAIREYVMKMSMEGGCKIVFTTGTFGDFYYGTMFGMNINQMVMEDTRKTNEIMTIHPDTFRINTLNYWREVGYPYKKNIIESVIKYHTKYPGIKFVCMKQQVAVTIHKWMLAEGYKVNVDYYGSTSMIGVEYDRREMVCIGAPVRAINAHDGISRTYEESQKTRINSNHAAFWQAVSRVKDPSGEIPSEVFCIGIREEEIRMMCTWGIDRRIEMDGMQCVGVSVKEGTENAIGMPNIESVEARKFLNILKQEKDADRTCLMKRMHISAKELDKMLCIQSIEEHVTVKKIKTGRKSKKVYNFSE